MLYSHNGMVEHHSRTGVTHDSAYSFPHGGFVAVDFAIVAESLIFHKGAAGTPPSSIFQQFGTFFAECLRMMHASAVEMYHRLHCLLLLKPLFLNLRLSKSSLLHILDN